MNFKDYSRLSRDWMKEGNLITDISGPNGKSDGMVDVYDLKAFSGEWLSGAE